MSEDDPRTYHIEQDREGFFVADDNGEDILPTHRLPRHADAKLVLDVMVQNFLAELFAEYDREASE